ncbi:NACHT domain-containing protein [Umezawaea sp. NPDC059074]|uniref:NACHT domain-containing protein n=1 Tax=Umezawaea sp. NPDC059074 TaxID=3346716 RepID=UPI0036A89E28
MSTFSYADAVKLMGASEHKLVKALDKVLGGALLAGSVLDVFGLLGWFDAKADFIRLSHEYAVKLSEKHTGLSRYSRTQRLHAAHTMVVLASFFEAFDESGVPAVTKDLALRPDGVLPKVPIDLVGLADTSVPLVTPELPYEDNLQVLATYYSVLTTGTRSFLTGLAVWDSMDDRQRNLLDGLPDAALRRYEENIRRLAVDCPEFAFWSSRQDHQATRSVVRTALEEVERLLTTMTVGGPSALRRTELAARYRSVLDHRIIEPDQVPDGLGIPLFRDCYIDPRFQVGRPAFPAQVLSWQVFDVRTDIHDFFIGHLTSPGATQSPLLVLGDPGSGKSALTKVLAARLPATDFTPLRIELRTAPTEADLLQQIEHGLHAALHEKVGWAEFARSADGALPVVFLDGFDELLQATGVSQTRYLKKVERFQRENADMGRPVAIIVTSRIGVADRAVIPEETTILRLSPFDGDQAERWLRAWNTTNARYFSAGLSPLPVDVVLEHASLAEQPLLLLMLALYDADGNALQRNTGTIGKAELYERLLIRFARREITKDREERSDGNLAEEVEEELERLSIVALAMFNRGVQWIREHELDRDLTSLLGAEPQRDGVREPLGAGEAVLGRFFFVQRAEAVRDEKTLRTYEFLHATFSEYLVARLTWRTLRDLLHAERSTSRLARTRALDDNELHSLLSFAPLTARQPVVRFLEEMAAADPSLRDELSPLLVRVFHEAHRHRPKSDYEPAPLSTPTRYAMYSVNIMVLAVVVHGELAASRLVGIGDWASQALFWRSQLPQPAWVGLIDTIEVTRVGQGADRDLVLRVGRLGRTDPEPDLSWHMLPFSAPDVFPFKRHRESNFLCDFQLNLDTDSLEPFDNPLWQVIVRLDGVSTTAARVILHLLLRGAYENTAHDQMWEALRSMRHIPDLSGLVVTLLRSAIDLDRVLPVMVRSFPSFDMTDLFFDRLGRGGNDDELLALMATVDLPSEGLNIAAIDAALRLHEQGDERLDVRTELLEADLHALAATRPDLVKRARYAAQEQGWFDDVTWP